MRYWPYALVDEADLQALMKSWGKNMTGLVVHWKLDNSEGTATYDSAGTNDTNLVGDPPRVRWMPRLNWMGPAIVLRLVISSILQKVHSELWHRSGVAVPVKSSFPRRWVRTGIRVSPYYGQDLKDVRYLSSSTLVKILFSV